MSGYAVPELQRAVIARLKAFAPLNTEIAQRVYDTVPKEATFPLVAINGIATLADDTDTSSGMDAEVNISVFARGVGARVDAQRIGAQIIAALDRGAALLNVPGHKVVMSRYVRNVVFRTDAAPTNGEVHGVFTFSIKTESLALSVGF